MKAKRFQMAAILCLATLSSTITWSDPLVCVDSAGTRMAFCPAFLAVEDWGDICTVYHDGTRTRSFACTEIAADEALTCLQVGCFIREPEIGCEGSFFDDGPCEGHQDLVKEFELFDLINETRVGARLPEVQYHPIASNVVEAYAEFICERGGCDDDENCHRLDGKSPGQRLTEGGVSWTTYMCENLAFGYTSAQATLDAWMDSSGHRGCILDVNDYDSTATHAGVAHVACTTAPDIWILNLFRSPSATPPSPMRPIRPIRPLPFKWYPLKLQPQLSLPPMESEVKAGNDQPSLPPMESEAKAK